MPACEGVGLVDADRADHDPAASLLEVLEQPCLVEPVVDREARGAEVARERQRLLATEVVPVSCVGRARLVPVVDAELALARACVMVVRDRVGQPPGPDLVCGALRVERRGQPALLEQEGEVQTRGARPDDSDVTTVARRHLSPPSPG